MFWRKNSADPVAHFKEVARQMTEEEQALNKLTLSINMDEKLSAGTDSRKNFGYAAILKIYHELVWTCFLRISPGMRILNTIRTRS
jgi:hypothetical protein